MWIDDPDCCLERHLHHIGLPEPGDDRALVSLVGRLGSHKLDRSRPLWDIWMFDELSYR